MKVKLEAYTRDADAVCGMAAKTCVSEGIQHLRAPDTGEPIPRTTSLRMALACGHESVAEHATFTFSIEGISRACSHQLVRHRMASYCVSADTKIRTSSQKTNGMTIRELYRLPFQHFKNLKVRCVDDRGNIKYNHPDTIVYSGVKPTYTVKTVHGYEIRTTKEHRFLTESGWKALGDIEVGEKVYINGQNSYKDRDWLYEMYHEQNLSQQEIADICGVSKNCIRAWVRKHGIQKERGSWSIGIEPHNKGKTKADYEPMRRTSEKMMGNHNPSMFRRGKDKIGCWKDESLSESGLRGRTAREIYPMRKNICDLCGFHGVTEFHHMNKNLYEYNINIAELCVACHKAIHRGEITQRIVLSEIVSINYYGDEDTYDIMMPDPYHNFIADGFVVHNSQQSQRYVNMNGFDYVIPKSIEQFEVGSQDDLIYFPDEVVYDGFSMQSPAQAYYELMRLIRKLYKGLVDRGIPEEDARYILPNACATNIVVSMNARELMHFFRLRCCTRAQWEIRELANKMLESCKAVAPILFEGAGPSCKMTGRCPEGANSCGRYRREASE